MKSTSLRIAASVLTAPVHGTGAALGWTGNKLVKLGAMTSVGGQLAKVKAATWKERMLSRAAEMDLAALTADQEQQRHNEAMTKLEEQRLAEVKLHEQRLEEVAKRSVVPDQASTPVDDMPAVVPGAVPAS